IGGDAGDDGRRLELAPLRFEAVLDGCGGVWVGVRQRGRTLVDHRHVRTKSRKGLCELDASRTRSDDDQFRRQPIEIEDRFVCEVGDAPQPWDRRYRGLRSSANDEVLRTDTTLASLNRLAVDKSYGTYRDFNPLISQNARRFVGVNASDYRTYFRHHSRKVDSDFSGPD